MNTPVSFDLAKLLKEKGFDIEIDYGLNQVLNLKPTPTIAEVVMWLYEKHEIWCYVYTNGKLWYPCIQYSSLGDIAVLSGKIGLFNSPTEAYEAAIEYTLNNLI